MNDIYPFSVSIILNDTLFSAYGGRLGTSTALQRNAAFRIAEKKVSDHISTLLLPTIVTGTYYFHPNFPYLMLDYGYVSRVNIIRFIDTEEDIYYTISGTANVYASLRNSELGQVDIHYIWGACNCSSSIHPWPYQVQVIYEAGLPTGVASNHPDILLALTTYADIILNEMIGYGNEAPGDIGVQSYRNQEYQEERYPLKTTAFGSSARAQFIAGLLERWSKPRFVRF